VEYAVLVILIVSLLLASLLVKAGHCGLEGGRKLVHVIAGCSCLTLPSCEVSGLQIIILAATVCAVLWFLKLRPDSLCGAGRLFLARSNYGEFYFTAGIVAAFLLSGSDYRGFYPAVVVLTFGDTASAAFGSLAARSKGKNGKTLEGSAAFAVTAYLGLIITGHTLGAPIASGSALLYSLFLALVESISTDGTDNFTIPLLAAPMVAFNELYPLIDTMAFLTVASAGAWLFLANGVFGTIRKDAATGNPPASAMQFPQLVDS
jgi:dolichol kinase